jgi:hypothetical protein
MCPSCGKSDCFTDRHHAYWPRSRYKTPLEREFRGLFITPMRRCEHTELHWKTPPPPKPTRAVMERIVNAARAKPRR